MPWATAQGDVPSSDPSGVPIAEGHLVRSLAGERGAIHPLPSRIPRQRRPMSFDDDRDHHVRTVTQVSLETASVAFDLREVPWSGIGTDWLVPQAEQADGREIDLEDRPTLAVDASAERCRSHDDAHAGRPRHRHGQPPPRPGPLDRRSARQPGRGERATAAPARSSGVPGDERPSLSQFFPGRQARTRRSCLPAVPRVDESAVLGTWRSVSSEHVAHLSPRRALDAVRPLSADERRQVVDAVNREASRFAIALDDAEDLDKGPHDEEPPPAFDCLLAASRRLFTDVRKLRIAQLASLCHSLTSVCRGRLEPSHRPEMRRDRPARQAPRSAVRCRRRSTRCTVAERQGPIALNPWRPTRRTNPPPR